MIEQKDYIESTLSLKAESFDIELIPEYDLILEIGFNYFRFAAKNETQLVLLEDYNYPRNGPIKDFIFQLFNEHVFLAARFWKSIKVLIHSKRKTVVPSKLNNEQSQHIWKALFGEPLQNDFIQSQAIIDEQTLIYATDKRVITFLKDFYQKKEIEFLPVEINLLPFKTDIAYLLYDGSGYYLVSKNETISTYYSHDYKVLLKHLKNSNIKLVGEITKYSECFKYLSGSGFKVSFSVMDSHHKWPSSFKDLPSHRYYALLSN